MSAEPSSEATGGRVAVVMGSDSDLPQLEGCFEVLRSFGIPFDAQNLIKILFRHQQILIDANPNKYKGLFGLLVGIHFFEIGVDDGGVVPIGVPRRVRIFGAIVA